ncbi:SGNH/GDSL hydrolase family protein [Streptomyces sp. NPDC051555]|uniref:SGNH/GDSL hydrolase family protein n=1 Tax=Streptomyces sp. NPDC051555 TaxID=3365657 RepID=UPI0037A6A77B
MILAALIGIVSCGPGPAAPCTTPSQTKAVPLRIMPLGDSITYGSGSSDGGGYRLPLEKRLAQQHDVRVDFVGSLHDGPLTDADHEGHGGYTVDQIRAGVDGWLATSQPDVILLHLGINDLNRGQGPGAADRLVALVDRIHEDQPTAFVLVQGLIPTTGELESQAQAFNTTVRGAASAHQYRWVEPPALTAGEMADRLHPNDLGYGRMAEAFGMGLDQVMLEGHSTLPPGGQTGCSTTPQG